MKKTLRYSFLAMLMMLCGSAYADVVTDELTWEGLGLNATNSNYAEFSDKTISSSAVYAGLASSGTGQYIQLRTKNSNEGIITTASGGTLKSVTIHFNASTTDRAVQIYGKNEPYSAATDLYGDASGELLGEIAANADSKVLTVSGNYSYVGLRSKSSAIYIDKITIEWESNGQPPVVETKTKAPEFSPKGGTYFEPVTVTLSAEAGDEIYYTLTGYDYTLYTAPFTLSQTTTVKAFAYNENNDIYQSPTVEQTYTIETMVICEDIASFVALDKNTIAQLNFAADKNVQVVLSNKGSSNEYVVLQDNQEGRIVLFNMGIAEQLKAGDVLTGSLIGKNSPYNGMNEMAKATETDLNTVIATPGAPVEPFGLGSVAEAKVTSMLLRLCQLKGLTLRIDGNRAYAIDKTGDEIQIYDSFKIGYTIPELQDGQTLNITGIVVPYFTKNGDVYEIAPISQDALQVVSDSEGITTMTTAAAQQPIYNLAGQRLSAPAKGICIVGGRKVTF